MPYHIPARESQVEVSAENSRFIAVAAPAFSVEEARAFIQEIRKRFPDASHHVPAFLIGHGSSTIAHSSDDGEPSGTAGRPILTVLQGSGLGDIVLVVVRYFGGTKLGTGGLVRAYTRAAQAVLAELPRAQKVSTTTLTFETPYPLLEQMRLLIAEHGGQIEGEEFAAEVTHVVRLLTADVERFQAGVRELSNGRLTCEIMSEDPETIFPLS